MFQISWPLISALVFSVAGSASARDASDPYESYRSDSDGSIEFNFDDSLIVPWKELQTKIPVLSEEGLKDVDIDHGPPGLSFQIDMDTLTVGQDDVVRYWLVTTSGGRRTNVIFEGINCAEAMHKAYAYASPRRLSLVKPVKTPRWEAIRGASANDYHGELMSSYFCWKGSPRTQIGMRNALRGSNRSYNGQREDADFIRP